jgi:hypothetical protein
MASNSWDNFDYVQIAGNPKSGTSLLSALIDNHPDVASFPSETSLTGLFHPILSDPKVSKDKKVDEIIAKRCLKETDGFVPVSACNLINVGNRLRSIVDGLDNTFSEIHFALLRAFYDEFDPQRLATSRIWVDKSPLSHLFADDVFNTFKNVKFIHILREPKNNFSSVGSAILKRGSKRTAIEAVLWRYRLWSAQSFYYARRNQLKYGAERYMVIRFEDLVSNPSEIIPELAEFIGIAETETLYQPTRAGYEYSGNNKNGLRFQSISSVNVDRWKLRIPPYFGRVMEAQPLGNLKSFDYHPYFRLKEIKRALIVHRLITLIIPRSTLLRHYHPQHFTSPEPGFPGLRPQKGIRPLAT